MFPLISIPGNAAFDATAIVADQRNVLLMADGGGILFIQHEPGIYEAHVNFLKAHRRQNAVDATIAACRWMFTHTDCLTLLARAPATNPSVGRLCEAIGAIKEFSRYEIWPLQGGKFSDVDFWALRYEAWIIKSNIEDWFVEKGIIFHKKLDEEFKRLGGVWKNAPNGDCAHYLYSGAWIEMIYGGQPEKAVILYNRWARWAWRGTISLVSRDPVIVDIGDAVLMFGEKDFKVLKART